MGRKSPVLIYHAHTPRGHDACHGSAAVTVWDYFN